MIANGYLLSNIYEKLHVQNMQLFEGKKGGMAGAVCLIYFPLFGSLVQLSASLFFICLIRFVLWNINCRNMQMWRPLHSLCPAISHCDHWENLLMISSWLLTAKMHAFCASIYSSYSLLGKPFNSVSKQVRNLLTWNPIVQCRNPGLTFVWKLLLRFVHSSFRQFRHGSGGLEGKLELEENNSTTLGLF